MDLDRLIAEAYDGQTREDTFRRFFLNQPTVRSNAWLSPVAWAQCPDTEYEAPEGTKVVLAFDGTYRLDSSALVAGTVEERPFLWGLACGNGRNAHPQTGRSTVRRWTQP